MVPTIIRALPLLTTVMAATAMLAGVETARGDAAPSAAGLERLTGFFENEVTTGKLAGAVVLIQQRGAPVYLKSFGVRDVATKRPMTPDTMFAIHSMTKPITSVAAMMLIDDGRLALADPVSKYIPAFAAVKVGVETKTRDGKPVLDLVPPNRPVTIEDLLRHTSGISYEYIGGELIMKAYSEANIFEGTFDNKEFAERIARLPLARQPGTLWRYGHSTDVLGRVIEIVCGKSLYHASEGAHLRSARHDETPNSFCRGRTNWRAWQSRCLPMPSCCCRARRGARIPNGNPAAAACSRPSPTMRDLPR